MEITRKATDQVRLRRAAILLPSFLEQSAAEAAAMLASSTRYSRKVIRALNHQRFAAMGTRWSKYRPIIDRSRGSRGGLSDGRDGTAQARVSV